MGGGVGRRGLDGEDPQLGRRQVQREAQQVGALRVEVAGVVDDEQDGPLLGEGAQDAGEREPQGDGVPVGVGHGGLAAQDGDGGALRAGQPVQGGGRHGGDERGGRRSGHVPVGGLRGQPEDRLAAVRGLGGGGLGDLGLAHARRSGEDGAAPGVQGLGEPLDEPGPAHERGAVRRRPHVPPPSGACGPPPVRSGPGVRAL